MILRNIWECSVRVQVADQSTAEALSAYQSLGESSQHPPGESSQQPLGESSQQPPGETEEAISAHQSSRKSSRCYESYTPIPKKYPHRQNLINIRSNSKNCFKLAFLSSAHFWDIKNEGKNPLIISSYKSFEKNYTYLAQMQSATEAQIKKFCRLNNISIKIYELVCDKYTIVHHYNTEAPKCVPILQILCDVETSLYHLCGIKKEQTLLRPKFKCGSYARPKEYSCPKCEKCFSQEKVFNKHIKFCSGTGSQLVFSDNSYTNYLGAPKPEKSLSPPFAIFFDFETTRISATDKCSSKTCKHIQTPDGYCNRDTLVPVTCALVVISKTKELIAEKFFYGTDATENFLDYLFDLEPKLQEKMREYNPVFMTDDDIKKHNYKYSCDHCSDFFSTVDKAKFKVCHHDHTFGVYLGALCNTCNLQARKKYFIPVYAHNNMKFDVQFVFKKYVEKFEKYRHVNIECLAKDRVNFRTFTLNSFTFIDTLAFFNTSLDKLAATETNIEKFIFTQKSSYLSKSDSHFKEKHTLLCLKPPFPYDFFSFETLFMKDFPSKEAFFNSLTDSDISMEDYNKAKHMYELFKCENLLDYTRLYNMTDCLLLADIFMNFTDVIIDNFNISPLSRYISLSQLSFDCMSLFVHRQKLYPRTYTYDDAQFMQETYHFVRGGQTLINKKAEISSKLEDQLFEKMDFCQQMEYLKIKKDSYEQSVQKQANKLKFKCSKEGCEKFMFCDKKPLNSPYCAIHSSSIILYIDRTALYSECMSLALPYSNYKIVEEFELQILNHDFLRLSLTQLNQKYPNEGEVGYIFVCDLKVPEEVQDKISSFPPLMQKETINFEKLSSYSQNLYEKVFDTNYVPSEKMISSVDSKEDYYISHFNLKFLLSLGIKLVKIKKAYSFTQSKWLKDYVYHLISLRKNAKSSFEKSLFKLMSNSIYGKLLNNIYNYTDCKFVNYIDKFFLYDKTNNIRDFVIHSDNLIQLFLPPSKLYCGRPRIVGTMILEWAKNIMHNFWYNVILKRFDLPTLLYSDTDSLIISLKNVTFESALLTIGDCLDTTNIKTSDMFKEFQRGGSLGYFKSETELDEILLFLGIRKKSYMYQCNSSFNKVMKGVKKTSFKQITYLDFLNCILNSKDKDFNFFNIVAKNHTLLFSQQNKRALSNFDDTNYYKDCGICASRHGHYSNTGCECTNIECKKIKFLLEILYNLSIK